MEYNPLMVAGAVAVFLGLVITGGTDLDQVGAYTFLGGLIAIALGYFSVEK